MDKPRSNKGYSLIETAIILMLLSLTASFLLKPAESDYLAFMEFQSSYLHAQYSALRHHSKTILRTNLETEFPVSFSANGNVNMGQTLILNHKSLVILLGTGRIHEKSVLDD
jgi:hypothetical protein